MSGEVLHSARPQGETTLAKALNAGLSDALAADDRVVLMGEDVGTLGGVASASRTASKPSLVAVESSIRRWQSQASSEQRLVWPCAGTARVWKSSLTASVPQPLTRSFPSWPDTGLASVAGGPCR